MESSIEACERSQGVTAEAAEGEARHLTPGPAPGSQPGSQRGFQRGAQPIWRHGRNAVLVLALLLAPACRCTCSAPGPLPEDAGLDAAHQALADRAEWPPFPDATPPDAYHPGPFPDAEPCDATFLRLPPSGLSFISVVSNQGPWVAYADTTQGGLNAVVDSVSRL